MADIAAALPRSAAGGAIAGRAHAVAGLRHPGSPKAQRDIT